MKVNNVYMGSSIQSWMNKKNIKYITFSVTDDCNLMCKYCYFTHKTSKNKMSFETAKAAVDFFLLNEMFKIYDGVVWDFIGGEPTLEMDLIDEICDYILFKMYELNHKWLSCYRIMIGTNGLLYSSEKFQKFLKKHNINLNVNITVDGSKRKHDLSRIKKDGTGSYDDVVKNLPLWFKQTGGFSTKATFSHLDLPFLKESIINLWELGFKNIMANVVFENVWVDGDDVIFENQLNSLADYVIENNLWNSYSVRFFSTKSGYPLSDDSVKLNYCGSGNMVAIDYRGFFYPCIRFMDSSLTNKSGRIIGDIKNGMDANKIRAFNALSFESQSPKECMSCSVANGCTWCTGFNFDASLEDTIFERQIFNCKMHKANMRSNWYFWRKYEEKTGEMSPLRYNFYTNVSTHNKYIYIYYDGSISHCIAEPNQSDNMHISDDDYKKAIAFCEDNHFIPIHVGFPQKRFWGYYIGKYDFEYDRDEFTIDIIKHDEINSCYLKEDCQFVIYKVSCNEIESIIDDVKKMVFSYKITKINIQVIDYYNMNKNQIQTYKAILDELVDIILDKWKKGNYIQINVVTDNLIYETRNLCKAGDKEWVIAPNGKMYACVSDYYAKAEPINDWNMINELSENYYSKNKKLIMCNNCNALKCDMCYVLNHQTTCEYIVPFESHCVKQNLELNAAVKLLDKINKIELELPFFINKEITSSKELDPIVILRGKDGFTNNHLYDV